MDCWLFISKQCVKSQKSMKKSQLKWFFNISFFSPFILVKVGYWSRPLYLSESSFGIWKLGVNLDHWRDCTTPRIFSNLVLWIVGKWTSGNSYKSSSVFSGEGPYSCWHSRCRDSYTFRDIYSIKEAVVVAFFLVYEAYSNGGQKYKTSKLLKMWWSWWWCLLFWVLTEADCLLILSSQ